MVQNTLFLLLNIKYQHWQYLWTISMIRNCYCEHQLISHTHILQLHLIPVENTRQYNFMRNNYYTFNNIISSSCLVPTSVIRPWPSTTTIDVTWKIEWLKSECYFIHVRQQSKENIHNKDITTHIQKPLQSFECAIVAAEPTLS